MSGILELKLMARERGVKNFSCMTKKQLCDAMGIDIPEKKTKVELTNTKTGEVLKFTSTTKAARKLGINPGIFYNYTNRAKVGEVKYEVKLHNYTKKTSKDGSHSEVYKQPEPPQHGVRNICGKHMSSS